MEWFEAANPNERRTTVGEQVTLSNADLDRLADAARYALDTWTVERLAQAAREVETLVAALKEERARERSTVAMYEQVVAARETQIHTERARAEKTEADASLVRAQSQAVIRDLAALRVEHERLGDLQGKTAEHNLAMHDRVEKAEAERDTMRARVEALEWALADLRDHGVRHDLHPSYVGGGLLEREAFHCEYLESIDGYVRGVAERALDPNLGGLPAGEAHPTACHFCHAPAGSALVWKGLRFYVCADPTACTAHRRVAEMEGEAEDERC